VLWLCLDLPFLSLEVCTRASAAAGPPEPFAVSEGSLLAGGGRRQQVLIANEAAMRGGVRPGMPLHAAQALVSRLRTVGRDETGERAALERLAAWAGQFTPAVSIVERLRAGITPMQATMTPQALAMPQALVLEVGGSLSLFGGLKRLRHALRTGVAELGYSAVLSVAPTPLAATWLACAADEEPVTDLPTLAGRLFELPLACIGLAEEQRALLQGIGLTTLGECLRLPRDGLARRLGAEFVTALDRAFGRLPDPRKFYVAPSSFEARLPLPSAVEHTEGVLFPLNRLLLELSGFLTARVAGVQALELALHHNQAPITRIRLGLARPTRDTRHLAELFRECLAHTDLPEPVEEIALSASQLLPLAASEIDFFASKHAHPGAATELIERLRARLGREAVQGLRVVAEHRPECAWGYVGEPGEAVSQERAVDAPRDRPLWLLKEPVPLTVQDGQPYLEGALEISLDEERIESGWWDGNDVRREYFVARDAQSAKLWVYRELGGERSWWLQGVFG